MIVYNGTHIIINVTCNGQEFGNVTYSEEIPAVEPICIIGDVNTTIIEGKQKESIVTSYPYKGDTIIIFNGTHTIINVTCNGQDEGTVSYSEEILPVEELCTIGDVNITVIEGQ